MAMLQQMQLAPTVKPQVVANCRALVDGERAAKGGVSGAAIKTAYMAVTAFVAGCYQGITEKMLSEMANNLEPFQVSFTASGGAVLRAEWRNVQRCLQRAISVEPGKGRELLHLFQ